MNLKTLVNRVRAAIGLIAKGSSFPFNVIAENAANRAVKMTNPYEKSVWVSRSIKKVAQPIASVPLRFTRDGRMGEVDYEDEQLDQYWSKPAVGLTFFDFIEATVGWINLAGEAFWVLDDMWTLPYPTEFTRLLVARPDRMREVVEDDEVVAWEYTDRRGHRQLLLKEQVVHIKLWNPYNEFRGLAPWMSAKCATEADYYACLFNRNLWENNGDRGPIIIGKSGVLQQEQRQMIEDALREKRRAAKSGDFKTMFLTGDIEVQDPQIQTLDASAVATRLGNRHEIATAFGVPPSMFDVKAVYSIGSASDRFILIEETCMPMAEKIADHIEQLARRMTRRDDVFAWFDWDEHSTMQQVRSERIDSALKLWTVGMPMRDINDYMKLGMREFEGWETGYLSFGVQPVGEEAFDPNAFSEPTGGGEDDNGQEQDEEEPEETDGDGDDVSLAFDTIRSQVIGRSITEHGGEEPEPTQDEASEQFQRSRPRRERQIWLSHMASRAKVVRAYQSRFNRVLMRARGETISNLSKLDASKGIVQKEAVTDIVFDRDKFMRELQQAMFQAGAMALDEAGRQLFNEMESLTGDKRDPWKTPPYEVIQYNRVRENKIVGAARNIFEEINQTIENGIKKGESISQISKNVRQSFNSISKKRAKTIAITETGAAYGQGRQLAMQASGVKYKQWLTSGLGNVRPEHRAANNQIVRMDQAFTVGGEALMHPGDPSGSAGNVINCHCVSVPTNNPNP